MRETSGNLLRKLVAEGHAALVKSNEPAVRDGDAMSVAGEIGKHRFRSGEGRLDPDEPLLALERHEMRGEGVAPTQALGTAGSRRGSRTMVSRRARSGRSSVTVKKKRKAATALLMLGGRTPVCA